MIGWDYEAVRSHVLRLYRRRIWNVLCRFALIANFAIPAVHCSLWACSCMRTCLNGRRSLHQEGIFFLCFVKSVTLIVGCLRFKPSMLFIQETFWWEGRSSVLLQDTKAGTDDLNHQLNCLFLFFMQFSETQDDISKIFFFFKQSKMIKCPIFLNWIMQQIVTFKKLFAEEISWTVKQISKLFVTYHLYWSVCERKSKRWGEEHICWPVYFSLFMHIHVWMKENVG